MGCSTRYGVGVAWRKRGHARHLGDNTNSHRRFDVHQCAMKTKPFRERHLLHVLCILYAAVWIVAAIHPLKRDDWLIENLLVFVSVPVLVFSYRRLSLSD